MAAKGKSEPVIIFEVYDGDLPEIIALKDASKNEFATGVSAYRKARFKDAEARFADILSKFPNDKASQIYLSRCREHGENKALENWDGVTRLDVK